MERLLEDAGKLSGVKYDISNLNDVYEAIHVIQTEMGITGTTAKEASTTIQGSLAMVKSAWQNLLVGFADENANLGELTSNLFNSIVTAGENIVPRIGIAVQGVLEFLSTSVSEYLPQLVAMIAEYLPRFGEKGGEIVVMLATGLIQAIPTLVASLPQLLLALMQGIGAFSGELILAGSNLILWLIQGIDSMIVSVVQKAEQVIISAADKFKEQVQKAKEWGKDLVQNFIDGIMSKIKSLANAVSNVASTVRSYLHFSKPDIGPLSDFDKYAPDMIDLFTKGLDINAHKIGESFNKTLDFDVATVPYAQSNFGTATSTAVNAMTGSNSGEVVNGNITLVTPDGKVLASWLFENLINFAKANGTPILAQ